jgi:hypothetical protein
MGIDARLEPGPSDEAERFAELAGNGELPLAGERDRGHGSIVRQVALLVHLSAGFMHTTPVTVSVV